jgi:hypothetical protein
MYYTRGAIGRQRPAARPPTLPGFGTNREPPPSRRLSRNDFPGISPKTIARIERKETEKPHGQTLGTLAKVLGAAPAEIETY